MLATLYGENPAGLPGPAAMSPEMLATVQQTVWNVVSGEVRPGGNFTGGGPAAPNGGFTEVIRPTTEPCE